MKLDRWFKSRLYPRLPSLCPRLHEKRRKGLGYRYFPEAGLECQREQDQCFWRNFLRPERGGWFLEIGGDGVVGNHSLGLETLHGWCGEVHVQPGRPFERAKKLRKCKVLPTAQLIPEQKQVDLLAIHQPIASAFVWEALKTGKLKSRWAIVENRDPDVHGVHLLQSAGYKLRFFCHDDEYYEIQG